MRICNNCGFTLSEQAGFCTNCGTVLMRPSSLAENAACRYCGGATRPAQIYADKELTLILTDRDEERFIHAFACTQCARVQLLVDFETEVEE